MRSAVIQDKVTESMPQWLSTIRIELRNSESSSELACLTDVFSRNFKNILPANVCSRLCSCATASLNSVHWRLKDAAEENSLVSSTRHFPTAQQPSPKGPKGPKQKYIYIIYIYIFAACTPLWKALTLNKLAQTNKPLHYCICWSSIFENFAAYTANGFKLLFGRLETFLQ